MSPLDEFYRRKEGRKEGKNEGMPSVFPFIRGGMVIGAFLLLSMSQS